MMNGGIGRAEKREREGLRDLSHFHLHHRIILVDISDLGSLTFTFNIHTAGRKSLIFHPRFAFTKALALESFKNIHSF